MNDAALIQLDTARLALAECKNVMEAKQISDAAEAARVYLERTNASVSAVNQAAEIRTLAERQMGEFLQKMPMNPGAKGVGKSVVPDGNHTPEPTLAEIGITKKQSFQAQRLASIPKEEFRERIEIIKASGERLTPHKVMNAAEVRRPRAGFNPEAWKRHAHTQVHAWLKAVPKHAREDAADQLCKMTREILASIL